MNTETNPAPTTESTAPTSAPATKPAKKVKAAKAKTAVKKSAAKAEKKATKKAKTSKKGTPIGPAALKQYAPEYHKDTEKKTAGGNVSVDSNDDVAKKLRGKDIDEVYSIVSKAIEVPATELKRKYGGLNVGMQRMNLGNRLRGVLHAK